MQQDSGAGCRGKHCVLHTLRHVGCARKTPQAPAGYGGAGGEGWRAGRGACERSITSETLSSEQIEAKDSACCTVLTDKGVVLTCRLPRSIAWAWQ